MTTPRPAFERPLDILERNRLVARAAHAAMVVGPLMLAASIAGLFPPGIMGFHVTALGLFAWYASGWKNVRAKRRRAALRADGEGVWVDGELVVSRANVADGFFQPRPSRDASKAGSFGSSVRLVDKRRAIVFEAEADERDALDLLYALGLDPGSKRADFTGSSPVFATVARNMAFVFGVVLAMVAVSVGFVAAGISTGIAFPMLVVPLLLVAMLPSRISVGIDAVHLRWMWTKKLIPMSTIAGVERGADRQVRLRLHDGSEELLYTSMRGNRRTPSDYAAQHRDAVFARIAEAHAAFRARGPAADVSSLVGRGTRSRKEWRAALAKLRGAEGGYREAVVRDDDLWRVVEDPSAPEDARGGAAMLLRGSLDDVGKARVRVAAEATASPKLRVALDAAAGEADERFDAALDELAGDDVEPRGRSRAS